MKAEIKIPKGYRLLKVGEYTQPKDLWLSFPDMEWCVNMDCFCDSCGHVIKTNVIPEEYDIQSGWMMIRALSSGAKRTPKASKSPSKSSPQSPQVKTRRAKA